MRRRLPGRDARRARPARPGASLARRCRRGRRSALDLPDRAAAEDPRTSTDCRRVVDQEPTDLLAAGARLGGPSACITRTTRRGARRPRSSCVPGATKTMRDDSPGRRSSCPAAGARRARWAPGSAPRGSLSRAATASTSSANRSICSPSSPALLERGKVTGRTRRRTAPQRPPRRSLQLLRAGARRGVTHWSGAGGRTRAYRAAGHRGAATPARPDRRQVPRRHRATSREYGGEGQPNREIAQALFVAPRIRTRRTLQRLPQARHPGRPRSWRESSRRSER